MKKLFLVFGIVFLFVGCNRYYKTKLLSDERANSFRLSCERIELVDQNQTSQCYFLCSPESAAAVSYSIPCSFGEVKAIYINGFNAEQKN